VYDLADMVRIGRTRPGHIRNHNHLAFLEVAVIDGVAEVAGPEDDHVFEL
jgi:hypothetical protein